MIVRLKVRFRKRGYKKIPGFNSMIVRLKGGFIVVRRRGFEGVSIL